MKPNYIFIEKTMFGMRKANVYKNTISNRYKIQFYTLKDTFLFTRYYKNIPAFITAKVF